MPPPSKASKKRPRLDIPVESTGGEASKVAGMTQTGESRKKRKRKRSWLKSLPSLARET